MSSVEKECWRIWLLPADLMAVLAPAMIPLIGPKASCNVGGAGMFNVGIDGKVFAGAGTTVATGTVLAGNGNVLAGTGKTAGNA